MVGFPIAIDLRNVAHSSPSRSSNTKFTAVHTVMDLDKKDVQTGTRWNPAPEQIQALEKMYRCGLRTPTAQQIQQIASQLRRFAKIEGKNVFYWFQNHKARERQKRRREFKSASEQPKPLQQHCCLETAICLKDPSPAMKRTCAEHNSNWGHSTSHSLTLSREPVMYLHMQRGELAASAAAVDMRHTSKQLGDGETTVGRRHAYWEVVQSSPGNLQLLFHPMESNLVRFNGMRVKEEGSGKVETLQLFPTINEDCCSEARDDQPFIDAANNKSLPVQFFQFL